MKNLPALTKGDKNKIKISIQSKLIGTISIIISLSLGTMIYLASVFFAQETLLRIQENNLNLVQTGGLWLESEFKNWFSKIKELYETLLLREEQSPLIAENFFKQNPEFFYVGIANNLDDFEKEFYSTTNLQDNDMDPKEFKAFLTSTQPELRDKFTQELSIFSIPYKKRVLMGISFVINGRLVAAYFNPSSIRRIFQKYGYMDFHISNKQGDLIMHSYIGILLKQESVYEDLLQRVWSLNATSGQLTHIELLKEEGEKNYEREYLSAFQKLSFLPIVIVASIPEDVALAPVRKIEERNILILSIVLILAVLGIYLYSKLITRPIFSMTHATKQIQTGNYSISVESNTRDELGLLAASFSNMAKGLQERETIKDAFGKFVNKEIVRKVVQGELRLGGEKKEVAILFSDIRNFTKICEKMDANTVVSLINDYFSAMVECIQKSQGTVDKYIGDAIMAHWGALSPIKHQSLHAVLAALRMRSAVIKFNQENKGKYPFINMACGISLGEVISGQVGSQQRLEYTIIGDPVNLAARLESLNKTFRTDIIVSESLFKAIGPLKIFRYIKAPLVKVKGKEKAQQVYIILGLLKDAESPKNIIELRKLLNITVGATQKTVIPEKVVSA